LGFGLVVKGAEYYKNLQLSDEEIRSLASRGCSTISTSLQQFLSLVANVALRDLFFEKFLESERK
jgi:hypothetical protein